MNQNLSSFQLENSAGPAYSEADVEAHAHWLESGTVTEKYLRLVLGDPLESVPAFGAPSEADSMASLQQRFEKLASNWKTETGHLSSIAQMAVHSDYQQIIGIGRPAVPLILRELEKKPDHWFWALHAITGIDPVPAEDRGRIAKMAAAWLSWGRSEGLLR